MYVIFLSNIEEGRTLKFSEKDQRVVSVAEASRNAVWKKLQAQTLTHTFSTESLISLCFCFWINHRWDGFIENGTALNWISEKRRHPESNRARVRTQRDCVSEHLSRFSWLSTPSVQAGFQFTFQMKQALQGTPPPPPPPHPPLRMKRLRNHSVTGVNRCNTLIF